MVKEQKRGRRRKGLIFIPFLTLLLSVLYYMYSFKWGGGVSTFVPAVLIWPFVVLIGFTIYITKFFKRNFLLDAGALLAFYTMLVTALTPSSSMFSLLSSLIYVLLWASLLFVFFHYTFHQEIPRGFTKSLWLGIPLTVFFFVEQVNFNATEINIKTLNPIFYLLFFVPFIFLEKRKLPRYIGLGLVFFCILLSNKRTALFAFLLVILYVVFTSFKSTKKTVNNIVKMFCGITFGVLALLLLYSYTMSQYTNIDWLDRILAISETGGGGRTVRWSQFFIDMNKANVLQMFFGHGNVALYYHNDLMQIIYNYGIIGGCIYTAFCVSLLVLARKMNKSNYRYRIAYIASLIIFFCSSSVEQVIVVHTWFLQMAVFWGIVIGDYYREINEKKEEKAWQVLNP